MSDTTDHKNTFVRDNLPPEEAWPDFINLDKLGYPDRLNVAAELVDEAVKKGWGECPCIRSDEVTWTYRDLQERVDRIANVLVSELGLVPGERVLLRAANNPMMVACYFAVLKAGGVVVATMPLLRAKELSYMVKKAKVRLALCDERLEDEMTRTREQCADLEHTLYFYGSGELETLMAKQPSTFDAVDTAADDPCLIAFTSGTTGNPKATVHFHRDILAVCDCFPKHVLEPKLEDIFIGSPPLAFTFGTGGLVWFPLRVGASVYLLEAPSPPNLAAAIERVKPTVCFTSPTAYRMMLEEGRDLSSLKKCVSAGETLPKATFDAWHEATGIKLIDGIGATEMLHIFISAAGDDIRPGATGKPVPGYEAKVVDEKGERVVGEIGRLAVRGPTGCRYLADPRQQEYVLDGWNLTGDAYVEDADGYFWFQSRADDMIISSGYNIAGPEVEDALLGHPGVLECAVVGVPDETRGHIVKAFVVLSDGHTPGDDLVKELQDYVKATIAPYKYPRAVEFIAAMPRTGTGKVQRFVLREKATP